MRKSVLLFTLIVVFLVVGSFTDRYSNTLSIEGTWELESFYNYDAENVLDTIEKTSLKKGHVLFFHQLGTKSHIFLQKTLVEGLLKRGHHVTTVFYVKTSIVHENNLI